VTLNVITLWHEGTAAMASTAAYVATVIYDAARRQFEAVIALVAPGLIQPLLVPVRVAAPQSLSHPVLVRHLLREAQRQILK
jgi:hypothetical protein